MTDRVTLIIVLAWAILIVLFCMAWSRFWNWLDPRRELRDAEPTPTPAITRRPIVTTPYKRMYVVRSDEQSIERALESAKAALADDRQTDPYNATGRHV